MPNKSIYNLICNFRQNPLNRQDIFTLLRTNGKLKNMGKMIHKQIKNYKLIL